MKDDYRTAYFNLHKKARLGANEDGKKKELLKDARLESLKKLAGVSLLSHSTLTDLQSRLAKVQTCFTLVKDDLDASAICPHCNFRPQEENLGASGVAVLDQIDQQLDGLLENWTKTLLDNLDDPTAKKSIKLLPDAQKEAVDAFLKAKKLPEKISNDLVQGMQTALSGLIAISGEARRTARCPERRRRSLHGRADSDSVRGVRHRRSPVARSRPRFVWSSTVARRRRAVVTTHLSKDDPNGSDFRIFTVNYEGDTSYGHLHASVPVDKKEAWETQAAIA